VRIGRVNISVSAVMPDEEVAALLHSDVTRPLLRVLVVAEDETGKPVQAAYGYYRGDRVRFEQTIEGTALGPGSVFDSPHGGRLAVSRTTG
jgi:DNA-binding GntR family transcriptional regulator